MKFRNELASLAMLAVAFSTLSATAEDMDHVVAGALSIERPWTRATAPGAPAAGGFLTITNEGAEGDRLLGGSTRRAERLEIHQVAMDGDVMRMRPLPDGLTIPAGETVVLAPGGYHIMLMGLKEPFTEGGSVEITLEFERAGRVDLTMPVGAIGANGPAGVPGRGHQ